MDFLLKIASKKIKIIKLLFRGILPVAKRGTTSIVALKLAKSAEN